MRLLDMMQHGHSPNLVRLNEDFSDSVLEASEDLALFLHQVKTLFVNKKYRQCIQVCESTLTAVNDEDVVHLYLHFYLGMANDCLAREMHDLSRYKSSRFRLAEQHYEEALRTVCELEYDHPASYSLPREVSSMSLLSALSSWSDKPAKQTHLSEHIQGMKKQVQTHLSLTTDARQRAEGLLARRQRLHSLNSPCRTLSFPASSLQSSKSYWSFTPESTKASEKQLRIEDGRTRAWSRQRFQPEKYRILAEQAMAEL